MKDNTEKQLLSTLNAIAWQLNEISRKLDSIATPQKPQPAAPDPKAEAREWLRAHFYQSDDYKLRNFYDEIVIYANPEDLGAFLGRMHTEYHIRYWEFRTTLSAKHLMAFVPMDRKYSVEVFRRTVSESMRAEIARIERLKK